MPKFTNAQVQERIAAGADHQERKYELIRMKFHGRPRRLPNGGNLTEAEAQAHCHRPDTRGNGWFDAYDLMKGCK